jgi:hypothetical protein
VREEGMVVAEAVAAVRVEGWAEAMEGVATAEAVKAEAPGVGMVVAVKVEGRLVRGEEEVMAQVTVVVKAEEVLVVVQEVVRVEVATVVASAVGVEAETEVEVMVAATVVVLAVAVMAVVKGAASVVDLWVVELRAGRSEVVALLAWNSSGSLSSRWYQSHNSAARG